MHKELLELRGLRSQHPGQASGQSCLLASVSCLGTRTALQEEALFQAGPSVDLKLPSWPQPGIQTPGREASPLAVGFPMVQGAGGLQCRGLSLGLQSRCPCDCPGQGACVPGCSSSRCCSWACALFLHRLLGCWDWGEGSTLLCADWYMPCRPVTLVGHGARGSCRRARGGEGPAGAAGAGGQ